VVGVVVGGGGQRCHICNCNAYDVACNIVGETIKKYW
jgi:hypothetical protein